MKSLISSILMSGIAASFMAGSVYGQSPDADNNGKQGYHDNGNGNGNGYHYGDKQGNQQQSNGKKEGNQRSNIDHLKLDNQNQVKKQPAAYGLDQKANEQIRKGIQSYLKNFRNVNFSIDDGVVTLSGSVPSDKDKENLEKAIRKIPGVKDVKNEIEVKEEHS
ncbi:MAG: BON domain-containing protein [Chlamydiales bacterium]|nr:BON domain-containing protein [Chlamydiales bacterium]